MNKKKYIALVWQGDKQAEEHVRNFPGPYNLALTDLFGLADVQFMPPPDGKA